jgi:ribosomal protein S18 acetylase RimI-like enzyme
MDIRIITSDTLNEQHMHDVRSIQEACGIFDRTSTAILPDAHLHASPDTPILLTAYERSAPVGFLHVFHPTADTLEIYAAVLPDYRRQGLFNRLLGTLRPSLEHIECSPLFICNRSSQSGSAVLMHLGYHIERTEYLMELDESVFPEQILHPGCTLERSGIGDLPILSELNSLCFEEKRDESESFLLRILSDENRRQYILYDLGEPVGLGSAVQEIDSVGLFGLGIVPRRRNQGLGRSLLQLLVRELAAFKLPIRLEVDSLNPPALHLYRKMGFREITSYDYYTMS